MLYSVATRSLKAIVRAVLALATVYCVVVLRAPAADATTLACSSVSARILDGIPGTGVLLAASSQSCPSAVASHSNGDADAFGQVSVSSSTIAHQHVVDVKASATFRITISEAFASVTVPAWATEVQLSVTSQVDPLRYSAVLQLQEGSNTILLVSGSPLLPGEGTVWASSNGALVSSVLSLTPGRSYSLYSRLASYGEVQNSFSLSIAAIPEPGTDVLLGLGIASIATAARRRRV